ncbi:recombination protein NinB, partial [Klebsiella aerogenes]
VEVIEAIYWFGIKQGVKFSEKSRLEIEWAKEWGEQHG